MSNHDYIAGNWIGIYTYDSEEFGGESIHFTMRLTIENSEISGKCQDSEEDGAIPFEASIQGFFDGKTLSLIKQYPCLVYLDENGRYCIDETQQHPEIHYFGDFDNGMFKGSWEMNLGSSMQGSEVSVEQITGKWEMKRE